MIPSKEFVYMY